jgi:hypothetical protein
MVKHWIDLESGTYGNADSLVIVEVDEATSDMLSECSDATRITYGERHGVKVVD